MIAFELPGDLGVRHNTVMKKQIIDIDFTVPVSIGKSNRFNGAVSDGAKAGDASVNRYAAAAKLPHHREAL